ncbi:O-antigen ligase family protein [Halococcus saccharolyticus]|uniref:Polysaccharide deacetylase n=1 Tax=Halococcus saccharolyticus DSM 5350 TaxID=1227455 RepID=M0MGI3_9EURY|nr:O-antigen ligase family protein [Halococcus saccharolyticus]EMA43814.1 polysaccharide deacetylase [Halococcus saccharolyticus DSM 5350]
MNLSRYLSPLPELRVGFRERHEILLLAAVLIVGLTFVSPVLSLVTDVPALAFVMMVGLIFGILAVLFRQVLAGSVIGLLVTSTFMANVPLASDAYLRSFPDGHLGPELWLVQVPIAVSIVLVLLAGPREMLAGATKSEGFFAAFAGWTVVSAVFGATVRLDTALYFSTLIFQGLIVFALLRYAVQQDVLSFETVAQVFVGTILAHSLFAVAQFFNRGIFGVGSIGEYARDPIAPVSLGPLGEFATGTYVAGFTGMSFLLASLIVLAVPLAAAMAIRQSGWRRAVLVGTVLLFMAVVRVTGSDAGRGALIVALGCFCLLLVSFLLFDSAESRSLQDTLRSVRSANVFLASLAALIGASTLFYLSAASGSKSSVTDISITSDAAGNGNTFLGTIEAILQNLSIPTFDIGTLGIRLQQYVAGIDLFFQYPIFGIGGSNFVYYSTAYGLSEPVPLHNIYIAMLAETGFPGFVLFMALLGSVFWCSWKLSGRHYNKLLYLGLFCGLIGWAAYSFWNHPIDKVTTMFPIWALAGAVVGSYSKESLERPTKPSSQ